jgi:acyl carrier protein phosphodiesterase
MGPFYHPFCDYTNTLWRTIFRKHSTVLLEPLSIPSELSPCVNIDTIASMNWLAHVLLSPDDAEFRVGNIAADWVKGERRLAFSPAIQRGFACHTQIDLFTDAHPIVQRSQQRIQPPYRRYAGVLVDVFYDHILTRHWPHFCATPLRQFVDRFYAQTEALRGAMPAELNRGFEHMRHDDWLGSYGTQAGIALTLWRVAHRLRPGNLLAEGAVELEAHYDGLQEDFLAFFPLLRQRVDAWMQQTPAKTPAARSPLQVARRQTAHRPLRHAASARRPA